MHELKTLSKKEDLVFVGGVAMKIHGLKENYNDIDVVVLNLEGLKNYVEYDTVSKFSQTGKRAFIDSQPKIDIFIEKELPEFELINGLKVQTVKSMTEYYEKIYPLVTEHWQKQIDEKLKLLRWQDKI